MIYKIIIGLRIFMNKSAKDRSFRDENKRMKIRSLIAIFAIKLSSVQ